MNSMLWIGIGIGAVLGSIMASVVIPFVTNKYRITEPAEDSMSNKESITEEFATYTAAMNQEVSNYADLLAGGDLVLRERLRRFERGGE